MEKQQILKGTFLNCSLTYSKSLIQTNIFQEQTLPVPRNLYRKRMLSRMTPLKNRIQNLQIHLTNDSKNINKDYINKVQCKQNLPLKRPRCITVNQRKQTNNINNSEIYSKKKIVKNRIDCNRFKFSSVF